MTSGRDLIRQQRLDLVREAEKRYGLAPTHTKDIDLGGAIYVGGGELDIEPTWFDMPGAGGNESSRRTGTVKRYGTGNSAAFALIESFARAYREPPLYVWRGPFMDMAASERLADHPLTVATGLLRRPNPGANYTMGHLRAAIAKAKIVAGNFYLVKARTGGGDVLMNTTGAVARLWPVWPTQMHPATYGKADPRPSNGWIDYYAYAIGRGKPLEIPVENVIHFRNGINPLNPRIGIGVVEEFALEVATDAEAALLVQAVMSNLGIPGLVFAPEKDATGAGAGIPKDDREAIKASITAKTTGKRRGEAIVLSRPTSLQQFQVNLDVLNLDHVWSHVETRISAVIGWPAILAGLQAGLENATYSNAQSLKRFATENAAVPTWEDDSEVWTDELGPEFGLGRDEFIAYDYLSVRALQEDENERWKRVGEAFGRNEITIGQHHQMLGLEVPDGVNPQLRNADLVKGTAAGITINMPGTSGDGTPVVGTDEAVQAAEREAATISAAKIGQLRDYAMGVANGTLERSAAVSQIMYTFNVSQAQADAFLGPEGTPPDVVARIVGGKAKALLTKALLTKAAERFVPPDGDGPLGVSELDEGELTAAEVSAALVRMADRLAEVDPEMAGILGAEAPDVTEPEGEGEKRLPFPRTKASRRWEWDPDSQRYRWPNTGRLVPDGRVFRARERMIEDSRQRMRSIAEAHTRGDISLSQMQKQMRREYTDQHIALRSLGRGGEAQLTRADREAISAMVRQENKYLAGFARDIADGKLTEAEILARSELYAGANMRQEYAAGRLSSHKDAGYTHKQRVGPNDERTCGTCAEEIGAGWVPIEASGFVIGDTQCQSRDRCEILFSRELPGGGREY